MNLSYHFSYNKEKKNLIIFPDFEMNEKYLLEKLK